MTHQDLSGCLFGRMTVVGRTQNRGKKLYWTCRCSCGTVVEVEAHALRSGHTRSCGCLRVDLSRSRGTDLTGRRFGRWLVRTPAPARGRRKYWLCQCECGNQKEIRGENLASRQSRSCGCLRCEVSSKLTLTHGHARRSGRSREYRAWHNAKTRCFFIKAINYDRYGGRGITMCKRWRSSFVAFLKDMGPCPSGCSLDRIDVDGDYKPSNCRWAPQRIQARNRRNNHYIQHGGERLVLSDWAVRTRISVQRLSRLISKGLSLPAVIQIVAMKRTRLRRV